MRIVSWNVNGIRASEKSGFLDWLKKESPDIVCMQETKAKPNQLSYAIRQPEGYHAYFASAVRPGYSGVALYTKEKPKKIELGIGIKKYDDEGRTIIAHYDDFILINSYYPNGRHDLSRIPYKLEYYDVLIRLANSYVKKGKNVILTGDFNTAHTEIDLARPKDNVKNTGFRPEEREKLGELIDSGFVDTFRHFTKEGSHYTWWSMRMKARQRNIGWRIDYFLVNKAFMKRVKKSYIAPDVMGSDHCPIILGIK